MGPRLGLFFTLHWYGVWGKYFGSESFRCTLTFSDIVTSVVDSDDLPTWSGSADEPVRPHSPVALSGDEDALAGRMGAGQKAIRAQLLAESLRTGTVDRKKRTQTQRPERICALSHRLNSEVAGDVQILADGILREARGRERFTSPHTAEFSDAVAILVCYGSHRWGFYGRRKGGPCHVFPRFSRN